MSSNQGKNTWLNDRIRLTQWDVQQPYKLHDLGPIHSINIDNDKKFIQLKQLIHNYNQEVQSIQETKNGIVHGKMKYSFIATLYLMLHDISQMKDKQVQKQYLHDIYDWANNYEFNKKSRPLTASSRPTTAYSRPTTGSTLTNMRKKILHLKSQQSQITQTYNKQFQKVSFDSLLVQLPRNSVQSVEIQKRKSLSETNQMKTMADQKKDYDLMHRTLYPDLEVAHNRLKNYPRRKRLDIQIVIPKQSAPIVTKITKNIQQLIQNPDLFQQLIAPSEEQQKINNEQQNVQIQDIPEIDFGGDIEQQNQFQQQIEQQVIDKLGPKIKVYKDLHVQVKEDNVDIAHNRKFKRKNNELKNIINDAETTKIAQQQWIRYKSKLNNEGARRRESKVFVARSYSASIEQNFPTNNIDCTKFRPQSAIKRGALQNVQKKRQSFIVQNVIHNEIKNIKLTSVPQQFKQVQQNRLTYQPKNRCLSACMPSYNKRIQFSEILSKGRQSIMNQLDTQVISIKQKLTASRVPISISHLRYGAQICGQQQMKQVCESQFPLINGKSLIHNPFFKVGKKKKKKKKK